MSDESPERIRVGFKSAVVIVAPFIWERYWEQIKACMPISLYLALFQILVLRKPIDEALIPRRHLERPFGPFHALLISRRIYSGPDVD